MASHGSHHIGWSSSGEEDPDEREEGQDREDGAHIGRTLRSTIVCVRPHPPSTSKRPSQSPPHKVVNVNEDKDEDSRRLEHLTTGSHHVDVVKGNNAIRVWKGSESERGFPRGKERGTIRFSRSSRERDNVIPISGVRDSDRDTAMQRDKPLKDRLRIRDEGVRREIGKRENDRLPDEDHSRDHRRFGGDMKGKEKRNVSDNVRALGNSRERCWPKVGDSYNRLDRGHNPPTSGRDRCDSQSSDERDADISRYSSRDDRLRSSRQDEAHILRKGKDLRDDRMKETDRGRDKDRDRGNAPLPELYSIHKATVHSVRPFGLFVKIDGFRNHGLVHLSQVSDHEVTKRDDADAVKVEALSLVAAEGESVWVKVISVKTEEDGSAKVGCSLKYVSQGDGRDLDPNNLQLEKLQTKPAWQAPKKLQLEAVYNVTCTRCGGHGHLKKECYSTGEKTYDLLQDGDDNHDGGGSLKDKGVAPSNVLSGGQSSKPPSGPVGRGRAMVQPAWMKHGVGVGGDADKVLGQRTSAGTSDVYKDEQGLPEKVRTVQEALAVIAKLKEEKHRRRDEKRERKHIKRSRKHSSKDGKRDKHRKRHSSEDDCKSRKKHRL